MSVKSGVLISILLVFATCFSGGLTAAPADKVVKVLIGHCDSCSTAEVYEHVNQWAEPHSNQRACLGGLGMADCELNDDELEVQWIYVVDGVSKQSYKYVVHVYPFTRMVLRQNILTNDDSKLIGNYLDYFNHVGEALNDMSLYVDDFLPEDIKYAQYQDLISKNSSQVGFASEQAFPSELIDCTNPKNRSAFYSLFLDNRKNLKLLINLAQSFFKENYQVGSNWDFSAGLEVSGALKRLLLDGKLGFTYSDKDTTMPSTFFIDFTNGSGTVFLDIIYGMSSEGPTAKFHFNSTLSRDSEYVSIDDRINDLKSGRLGFIENACDAYALAKLASQKGYTPSKNGSGNGAWSDWPKTSSCNKLAYSSSTTIKYIYTIFTEADGSIYIDVKTELEEQVTKKIECL